MFLNEKAPGVRSRSGFSGRLQKCRVLRHKEHGRLLRRPYPGRARVALFGAVMVPNQLSRDPLDKSSPDHLMHSCKNHMPFSFGF